jgi:hypothetical protein
MLAQLHQLKLDSLVLRQLQKLLSAEEQKEFDAKYGERLADIKRMNDEQHAMWVEDARTKYEKEAKQRADEEKRRKEEAARQVQSLTSRMNEMKSQFESALNAAFDPVIEAEDKAEEILKNETPTLDAFYKYFGSGVDALKVFQQRVREMACDYYDYGGAAEDRFLDLLSGYSDEKVSLMAKMLRERNGRLEEENEEENEPSAGDSPDDRIGNDCETDGESSS